MLHPPTHTTLTNFRTANATQIVSLHNMFINKLFSWSKSWTSHQIHDSLGRYWVILSNYMRPFQQWPVSPRSSIVGIPPISVCILYAIFLPHDSRASSLHGESSRKLSSFSNIGFITVSCIYIYSRAGQLLRWTFSAQYLLPPACGLSSTDDDSFLTPPTHAGDAQLFIEALEDYWADLRHVPTFNFLISNQRNTRAASLCLILCLSHIWLSWILFGAVTWQNSCII